MSTKQHKGLTFKILYPKKQIEEVIQHLAHQINSYYRSIFEQQGKLDLVIVCVLKGAFMFCSDLVKCLEFDANIEFVKLKSYQGTETTGKIRTELEMKLQTYEGKNVLIVEDIHDTGTTLAWLIEHIKQFKPAGVDTVVLVKRPDKPVKIDLKFVGLECSDFIIGYGLDFQDYGRALPDIYQKV